VVRKRELGSKHDLYLYKYMEEHHDLQNQNLLLEHLSYDG